MKPEAGEAERGSVHRTLFYAILVAFLLRLIVVAFVYKGFLDPGRDHWEFGHEIGRVARSILVGHGFANPYWADTGPTALLTPVFPYFFSGIFAILSVCTKASALAILTINSLFSALTCLPIFFSARIGFGLRTAKRCAWGGRFSPTRYIFIEIMMNREVGIGSSTTLPLPDYGRVARQPPGTRTALYLSAS
jgi:hypothetical protein